MKQTLGQYRVGTAFNPSKDTNVDKVKTMVAALIDMVMTAPNIEGVDPGELANDATGRATWVSVSSWNRAPLTIKNFVWVTTARETVARASRIVQSAIDPADAPARWPRLT